MKMTVWFEKFLPKAESGVQNGFFSTASLGITGTL